MSEKREPDATSHEQAQKGDVPAIVADLDKLKSQLEQLLFIRKEPQRDQGNSEQRQ